MLSFHLKTQGLFLSVLKPGETFFIEKISWFYHPVITSSQDMTMTLYHSVTELIGRTPLIQLHKLDTGPCSLFLKLENQNPGGSIKDRVALSMINEAERTGQLRPGGTIIEATAGNTGLGLALIAAQKGYSLILVVPDKMSREKIFHLRA
ncbi:Cystathionine beta-synthase [Enterobacter hormaechei]|nr:Cystathionine beta-synthase [Enterobacter hormaechei]